VELLQKAGMSNLGNANSPAPVSLPPLRTWDFVETAFVSLIAYGVNTLTLGLTLTLLLTTQDVAKTLSPEQIQAYGAAYIVASPLTIAVLWIAIRMAGGNFAEYLALNWPSSGQLLRALAITALLLLAEVIAKYVRGAEEIPSNVSVERAVGFFVLLIGGCIAAPLTEEFVVRGFMFRGWSQSFLGPIGSIVVTSVVWAMIHTQYNWFGRFWIFATGLALGHFRWRSNSTWLTVMVHSAINIVIFFTMGL
jgi:membrane protease YdiL (CAAX protease family)